MHKSKSIFRSTPAAKSRILTLIFLYKCSLILIKLYQKMPFNKRGQILLSAAKFIATLCHILKRVGNTGRKANTLFKNKMIEKN